MLAFTQCHFAFNQFVVAAASGERARHAYKLTRRHSSENHFNPTSSGAGRFQLRHFDK